MKLLIIFLSFSTLCAKTIRYDLFVKDTTVNYSGEIANAIAVNGQIPAPTLHFTEGDTAEIFVHNLMGVETSIHWHGILLPNEQDGVPYLTTSPILPHTTHRYYFPIIQNGTFWYHAHTSMQEQSGLYGALILHKKEKEEIPELIVLLSDWTNENPEEVMRSLKVANHWYAIQKGAAQDYGAALLAGHLGTKITQEWLRMFPMDVSDVYYDAFLVNGKTEQTFSDFKAGDKVKLRIINGSASTYFWVQFAGGKLTVIASDGEDVEPVDVDRMLIGVAETYDVIVTVPEDMKYELKATAEDRTKSTSLWLGEGMEMPAPTLPPLLYFEGMKMMNEMMNLDGSMNDMGMQMSNQEMDMNEVMYPEIAGGMEEQNSDMQHHHHHEESSDEENEDEDEIVTLNYGMLKSIKNTTLPKAPTKELHFTLTGNMNRYQWSINNITLSETDKILIRKGENVRIVLKNESMMRHPMHLHGHYFRVLNKYGEYSPLKNVLDIMPMETDTIEFAGVYDGDWFFHCHILYHMMGGMGRVFSYANSPVNPQISSIKNSWQKFISEENEWHYTTSIAAQSNGIFPSLMVMDNYYFVEGMGMANYKGEYEGEILFGRLFGTQQFLKLYVGGDFRRLNEYQNIIETKNVATLGIQYLLPMFLEADVRVDHTGKFRFQIGRKELSLTSRLQLDGFWNTDSEYEIGLHYILTKRFSLSANYDSHFGFGGGITFIY